MAHSGRTKDLIVRGGMNIAPLGIDEVLLKHPGVLDAALGVPDPIQGEEVACYVVARPGSALNEAAVIEHCRNGLLAPKVPKRVVIIAERQGPARQAQSGLGGAHEASA